MWEDKTLLITGGTGSFANAVIKRLIHSSLKEIRIFSRDEKKQDSLRKLYKNQKVSFHIGDVRDPQSINNAARGVDFIFHAAALKQVPSCEFYPIEAVKTNILGTTNVIDAAINKGVKKLVCLSTDKAVYPINAMGISKAMMEKVMVAASRHLDREDLVISGTRYGNVMGSRGSVIPLFLSQIKRGIPITLTDPLMTRFMMTLDESVDLVLYAFNKGNNGDIFVQKAPSANLETLSKAILELLNKPNYPIDIIGTRHGEKAYESLLGREERSSAEDLGSYFRLRPDSRDLNYEIYYEKGIHSSTTDTEMNDYNSDNTIRLDINEMKKLLLKLDIVNDAIKSIKE